jgi:thiol:disulfide interchange protein
MVLGKSPRKLDPVHIALASAWQVRGMFELFFAYALFIIILAIPYLVVAAIVGVFCAGVAGLIAGIVKRHLFNMTMGIVLILASSASGWTIRYWATTPPADDGASSLHSAVYHTYRALRARQQAMQWMRDGTFERLAKERQPPPTNPGASPPR